MARTLDGCATAFRNVTVAMQKLDRIICKLEITGEDWNDGALGLSREGEISTLAIQPGWRFIASSPDGVVEYRTDADGKQIRCKIDGMVMVWFFQDNLLVDYRTGLVALFEQTKDV